MKTIKKVTFSKAKLTPFKKLSKSDQKEIIVTRDKLAKTASKDVYVLKGMGGKEQLKKYKAYTAKLKKMR